MREMNQAYGERVISDENSRAALWPVLTKIDADLAEQAWIEGCAHCGGALHRADYPRKVRGVNVEYPINSLRTTSRLNAMQGKCSPSSHRRDFRLAKENGCRK